METKLKLIIRDCWYSSLPFEDFDEWYARNEEKIKELAKGFYEAGASKMYDSYTRQNVDSDFDDLWKQ